jgi:hypothetical protein
MLYLIQTDSFPYFKVGFTEKDAKKRCQDLQVGCPFRLHVVATKAGSVKDEKTLLNDLRFARTVGEWLLARPEVCARLEQEFGVKLEIAQTEDEVAMVLLFEQKIVELKGHRDEVEQYRASLGYLVQGANELLECVNAEQISEALKKLKEHRARARKASEPTMIPWNRSYRPSTKPPWIR